MRIFPAALMAAGPLVLSSECAKGEAFGATTYAVLDHQASQLRADFNRDIGSVRPLFVVDPICPTCLRGLADMNRDLLRGTADPRLQVFVVYEPVLGVVDSIPGLQPEGGKDVPKAAQLLQNPNVHNYWNPTSAFGRLLLQAVGLRSENQQVYAGVVWLICGPDAQRNGAGPLRPLLLIRQLQDVNCTQFPQLDSRVFAQQVQPLLARLAPPQSTAALAKHTHQ